MSEQSKRIRRRKYLVDKRLQVTVTLQLMAVMAGMGLLYTVALHILPGSDISELEAADLRSFTTRATAVYFALATAILGTLTIIVTHRVAGPARVIELAVDAMRRGDYSARLRLRRRDHLKELAAAVAHLRDHQEARDQSVADLVRCVEEGDVEGARELADQLGVKSEQVASEEVVSEPVS